MTPMLRDQLGICEHELISIVGAGGKSAVLFTLGRELAIDGGRVILTTTTKMARDQVTEPVCWSADPMAAGRQLLAGSPLFVALGTIPGKVTGPTPEDVDRLFLETSRGLCRRGSRWGEIEICQGSGRPRTGDSRQVNPCDRRCRHRRSRPPDPRGCPPPRARRNACRDSRIRQPRCP